MRRGIGENLKSKFDEHFSKKIDRLDSIQIGERYNSLFTLLVEIYAQNSKFNLPYVFGQAEDFDETQEDIEGCRMKFKYLKCLEFELHAQTKLKEAIRKYLKNKSMDFAEKIQIGIKAVALIGKAIKNPDTIVRLIKVIEIDDLKN